MSRWRRLCVTVLWRVTWHLCLMANPELTLILVSHHLTPERKGQFTQVYDLQPVAAQL